MFYSRSFIVSGLTFRSLIRFEFIFVYGVRKCSSFILSQVIDRFHEHHLLKRLSFLHCIFLPPLSKVKPEISVLVMGLLRLFISSGSFLEGYTFLRIHLFLPSCPFYWQMVVFYDPVYFHVACCDFSIFISNFFDLILLLFVLDESGKWFVYFIYLLKDQAFSFC